MTTGQWLRILSTIDNGTALQHFKSIKLQPCELALTIHTGNIQLTEEENMVLYDLESDKLTIEESMLKIEEEVILINDGELI